MVDEVVSRYSFQGKSVLSLASNCGYWSSRYVAHGARKMFGVEGREQYLEQAKLYWSTEQFPPIDARDFVSGNVLDVQTWSKFRPKGPFDFTVCAGPLYHLPDCRQLLAWIAAVTNEALVIDTRVTLKDERPVDEPGDLCFNAIEATRTKIVLNLRDLLRHIQSFGFQPEVLSVRFESPPGLRDVDDYNLGNRVTILAKR